MSATLHSPHLPALHGERQADVGLQLLFRCEAGHLWPFVLRPVPGGESAGCVRLQWLVLRAFCLPAANFACHAHCPHQHLAPVRFASRLNCTVKCTPEGVYLDILHESHITMLNLLQENTENLVYQWTVINFEAFKYLQEYVSHLERIVPEVYDWVSQHHMDREGVQTRLHCIADCNVKGKNNVHASETL